MDAGAPDGVINLVTSTNSPAVARQLLGDARVRKLSFTGSTDVGKQLIRLSAENVTRLSLELGGHSPYVIFEDADLDLAADQIVVSKFRNSGQTCVCANRAYVQQGVYDTLLQKLAERTANEQTASINPPLTNSASGPEGVAVGSPDTPSWAKMHPRVAVSEPPRAAQPPRQDSQNRLFFPFWR